MIPTTDIPEDLHEQIAKIYLSQASRANGMIRHYRLGLSDKDVALMHGHVVHTTDLAKHFSGSAGMSEEIKDELKRYTATPGKRKEAFNVKGFFTEKDGSFSMGRLVSFELVQVGIVMGILGVIAALKGNANSMELLAFAGSFIAAGTGAKVFQKKYENGGKNGNG